MKWGVVARIAFVAVVAYCAHGAASPRCVNAAKHRVRRGNRRLHHLPRRSPAPDPARQHRRRDDRGHGGPAARAPDRRRALLGERGESPGGLSSHADSARPPLHRPRPWCEVGRVARARAAGGNVPAAFAAPAALQDSRHERHHRRPHRRHLRDGVRGRHSGRPAVCAEGAAAGCRLGRLPPSKPRPPRPRYSAAHSEDGRARRRHLRRRFPGRQGSRPQAHRARPDPAGQDRDQRFQSQQGRAAAEASRCSTSTSWPTR